MAGANEWSNWAGNQTAKAAKVVTPRTASEVVEILRTADDDGMTVKAVGSGHSFTPAAVTDGVLIKPDGLTRLKQIDREAGLVTVESGMPLHQLNALLAENGMALTNMGDIQVQTVAGAQPAILCFHRLQPLLVPNRDAPHHLPVEERTESAAPRVIAERGEGLADQHHVGFGNSGVHGARLIHSRNPGLQTAGGGKVRVDGSNARVKREHLHRTSHDFGRAVALRLIQLGQGCGVIADPFVPGRNPPRQSGPKHLG